MRSDVGSLSSRSRAASDRGCDRDPNGPRPVYSGLGRAALLHRAIERDPSVGQGPTRGPAIVVVRIDHFYEPRAAVYLALKQIKHSRAKM